MSAMMSLSAMRRLQETDELPVMHGIEVALDVALDDVVVLTTGVEQGHHDRDGVHSATTFAKPVRVRPEVRFEDRVQDGAQGFLHDAVAERRDAQRSPLAIRFGDVRAADGRG